MFILCSINKSYKSQHIFITIYKLILTVFYPPPRYTFAFIDAL